MRWALALEYGQVLLDIRRVRLCELAASLAVVTQTHEPSHAEEAVEQHKAHGNSDNKGDVCVYVCGWHGCGVDGATVPAVADVGGWTIYSDVKLERATQRRTGGLLFWRKYRGVSLALDNLTGADQGGHDFASSRGAPRTCTWVHFGLAYTAYYYLENLSATVTKPPNGNIRFWTQ